MKISKAVLLRRRQEALAKYGEWDGESYWLVHGEYPLYDKENGCDCVPGRGGRRPDQCICSQDDFLVKANSQDHALDTIRLSRPKLAKLETESRYQFVSVEKASVEKLIAVLFMGKNTRLLLAFPEYD
jgi:hypothetical protein